MIQVPILFVGSNVVNTYEMGNFAA